ncbi:MAG: GNAT family N-acetyltransferase [Acetobacteraceae bacterium]|nr:GNAT family N-acetyltransferase [Acetobacteraceae bacterium]
MDLIESLAINTMPKLTVEADPCPDFLRLGLEWRRIEPSGNLFQSWTWAGCLAAERFPRPLLLRARLGDSTVGLALFNRRRWRLALTEADDRERDGPYVEHNAPVVAPGAPPGTAGALLRAAWRHAPLLRLSGVPAELAALAGGEALRRREDRAPWLDLEALRDRGTTVADALSANTRQQLRRSARALAPLSLDAARDVEEALAWLDELAALHGARWRRRGQAGAFERPFFRRFHAALIAEALPRGEVELLRLRAAGRPVGYLYNFRHGGVVQAYQSGFDDTLSGAAKPGLTAHLLAMEAALARGDRAYDFLAGPQRYKRSFASGERRLVWTDLARENSLPAVMLKFSRWIGLVKA